MANPPANLRTFESLLEIVQELRGENGCPWDREQTHQSLARYAIEEVYELVEAIENEYNDSELMGELGDVLFQVVLHSEIAHQEKRFDIFDVIEKLAEKMVRRHPHVFSDVKVANKEEVVRNWDAIKKGERAESKTSLATPKGLPALMEAEKIGKKTKKFGFDWHNTKDVLAKVKEEVSEIEDAIDRNSKEDTASEIGDALFSLAQLARHLNMDPEQCLRQTNTRFRTRFQLMLEEVHGDESAFTALSDEQKEALWAKVKKKILKR